LQAIEEETAVRGAFFAHQPGLITEIWDRFPNSRGRQGREPFGLSGERIPDRL